MKKAAQSAKINQRVRDEDGHVYDSVDAFSKAKLEQASKTLARINLTTLVQQALPEIMR